MRSLATLAALAAALPSALAAYQGFNYGSTFTDGSAKQQSDFETEFKTAASLAGTNGAFTSARLYTMIQGGSASDVISAIPAAISTKTTLLLGLWASAGDAIFANEITALKSAIATYGDSLAPLVAGISVGSEDLYRVTPTGIANTAGVGVGPDVLARYIKEVRDTIAGTALSGAAIGHVDTWTAWVNSSNNAVTEAVDWLGVDAYPYFQTAMANGIASGASLLNDAIGQTAGAAGGKPVWVTETGWPVSGDVSGQAVASLENAKTYWDDAGCPLFGSTNIWWYTLQDAAPTTPNPSFGVVGSTLSSTPLYDLSCNASTKSTSSSSSSSATSTSTSTSSSAAATGSATGSATGTSTTLIAGGGGAKTSGSAAAASSTAAAATNSTGSGSTTAKGNATASATGTGSGATGSGSGKGSGSSATASASSTPSTVVTGAANALSGSVGAGIVAVVVAMLAL